MNFGGEHRNRPLTIPTPPLPMNVSTYPSHPVLPKLFLIKAPLFRRKSQSKTVVQCQSKHTITPSLRVMQKTDTNHKTQKKTKNEAKRDGRPGCWTYKLSYISCNVPPIVVAFYHVLMWLVVGASSFPGCFGPVLTSYRETFVSVVSRWVSPAVLYAGPRYIFASVSRRAALPACRAY